MFDWIPSAFYTPVFYYSTAIIVLYYASLLIKQPYNPYKRKETAQPYIFSVFFLTLYIGLRPINGYYFGDMDTYSQIFAMNQEAVQVVNANDWLFDWFIYQSAQWMSVEVWFLLCAFLYIFPLLRLAGKYGGNYSFFLFILLIGSFSFWTYGTNGIRNGMATSIFLLALTCRTWKWRYFWFFVACNTHSTMLLPTTAYFFTLLVKNPKYYFYGWLSAIPLALIAGGVFQSLFAGMMEDDRMSYLTDGNINNDAFSYTGFRWDFLLYSAAPVYNAYYFIIKRKWSNAFYNRIVCIYLTCNAFWILVIKSNFSNRFAYISWFMMALIIAYPWVQREFMPKQTQKMAYILLSYFGFTFLMNVILA